MLLTRKALWWGRQIVAPTVLPRSFEKILLITHQALLGFWSEYTLQEVWVRSAGECWKTPWAGRRRFFYFYKTKKELWGNCLRPVFTKDPRTILWRCSIKMCMVLGIWSQIQVRQTFKFVTIQWNLHQACSTELGTSEALHSEMSHTFSHVLIATFTPALFGFH